jgi:hypothetical protein
MVPGAGHVPGRDDLPLFNEAVLAFLREHGLHVR